MNVEQIRQQASNENTAPEILAHLASSKDYVTRQLVTANPNTPTATLLNLGAEFPRELINNPIFDLLILEDINFINKIPIATLRSILSQQDVPQFILEQAGERADLEVQLLLVNKIDTSKKILQKLATSPYPEVAEAAKLHINLVGELTEDYEREITQTIKSKLNNRNFLIPRDFILLTQICLIPSYIIECLIENTSYERSWETIINSATSSVLLQHIFDCNQKIIQELIANNIRVPRHNISLDYCIAKNKNTPVAVLEILAKRESGWNRTGVASNANTPIEILWQLAKDEDYAVRNAVAKNDSTPLNLLLTLAQDVNKEVARFASITLAVRYGYVDYLVNCDKTEGTILRTADEFASKQNELKFSRLISRNYSDISPEALEKIAEQYPLYAAKHPNTPIDLLLKMSQDESVSIRRAVAINSNLSIDMFEDLATDEDIHVLVNLGQNYNTPLEILFKKLVRINIINSNLAYKLANSNSESREYTKDILAEESASSLETILQRLIDDGDETTRTFLANRSDLSLKFLIQLFEKSEYNVLEAIAKNPNTSNNILEELATNLDSSYSERQKASILYAITQHPNTSDDVLKILIYHNNLKVHRENEGVRALAMSHPNLAKNSIEQILCGEYAAEYPQCNPDFLKDNPDSLTVVLDYYTRSRSQLTSYITLLQPQVSSKVLEEKSRSVSWLDRFAVAQNTTTSTDILKRLTRDCNQLVRAAARDNVSTTEQIN